MELSRHVVLRVEKRRSILRGSGLKSSAGGPAGCGSRTYEPGFLKSIFPT
ncbi:unnamed protein product [[Actinomadura] parvosata subsp. kistnae]|nr:unnamed protein product [Actinomadura parvosata subsp. kistnae]